MRQARRANSVALRVNDQGLPGLRVARGYRGLHAHLSAEKRRFVAERRRQTIG